MANIAVKFGLGGGGGTFAGVQPLGAFAGVGNRFPPHWATINSLGGGLATTATRLYYVPYYFNEMRAFTGLKSYNTGSGDNGETFRMGVYRAALLSSGLRGAPSTLLADCGQVTLTGAAAERTLASSFTPDYVGWHFLALHANSAFSIAAIQNIGSSDVPNSMRNAFGNNAIVASGTASFGAFYVDTAYGALASTAVAPTAVTDLGPLVVPYLT